MRTITNEDGPVTTQQVVDALDEVFKDFPKKVQESETALDALEKAKKVARGAVGGKGSTGEGNNFINKPFYYK